MSLSPDRWKRADALFDQALDLPPEERASFVAGAAGQDAELAALVMRLLHSADMTHPGMQPGGAASGPLWDRMARGEPGVEEAPAAAGAQIGRYRVLREIGRGGMAIVYLAERADGEFRQHVALKLIRGTDTEEAVRRFLRERQIMALASHPNVARLLDGGATPDGRPYFVMEHVDGEPIDAYCDQRRLGLRQRLELFLQAAAAVGYAHRNLVVHRDIKPSNILVNEAGVVKLLDFGIARYLDEEDDRLTRTGHGVMTPEFASPEQITGGPVTTTSDIFQLGLLLCWLVAGRLPRGRVSMTDEVARSASARETPRRPSSLVTPEAQADPRRALDTVELARRRNVSASMLHRELSGDLDNIILMALRPEPERRYGTVDQLADDVRRHLAGEPVSAHADSLSYRAGKFVRRHRLGVGVAAASILLLLAFAITMTVQAGRIARERDRANREAAAAAQVSSFLTGLFQISDPGKARGESITAREVLDRGVAQISGSLKDQPEVRARLMQTMGRVYQSLGLRDSAMPLLREALETQRAVFGPDHPEVARSLGAVGWLLDQDGRYDEAEPLYQEALAISRRAMEPDDPDLATALNNMGLLLHRKGHDAEAEPLLREAIATQRRSGSQGDEAELGDQLSNLSIVRHTMGALDEAEALEKEALTVRRATFGDVHPSIAISLDNLGRIEYDRKNYDGAADYHQQALTMRRTLFGPEHPEVSQSLNNLAADYYAKGDLEASRPIWEQLVELDRKLLGDKHPDYGVSLQNLASLLMKMNHPAQAEPLLRQAMAVYEGALPAGHPLRCGCQVSLGVCLTKLRRYAEAEASLRAGYDGLHAALGAQHQRTQAAAGRLADLYDAWSRPSEATRYRALAQPPPAAGS